MLLFSTVLFIDGKAVGYKVVEEENRLILNPAENPSRDTPAPVLSALRQAGEWRVEGTTNRDVIRQVIEDVTLSESLSTNLLSAAP